MVKVISKRSLPLSKSDLQARALDHWQALLLLVLIVSTLIAYGPVFHLGFMTGDYIEIGARHFDALASLAHQDFGLWAARFAQRAFVDPVTDWPIFRPVRQWLLSSEYLMWHLDPLGYHIVDLILHLLTSFLVALIAWRLTRRKWTSFLAGLLFTLFPVLAIPVAWISALGHRAAGLFVALSFLCYLLPRKPLTVGLAMLGFALALGSKETAAILPGLLLLYEGLTGQLQRERIRGAIQRLLPFWMMLGIYFLARLAILGTFVSTPYPLGTWLWQDQAAGYIQRVFAPFLDGWGTYQVLPAFGIYLLLLFIYRSRQTVLLGLLWVPIALLPTVAFRPTDRYFYTPSIGLTLALASILSNPVPALLRWSRVLGLISAIVLIAAYTTGFSSIEDYVDGNRVVNEFLQQVKTLHPSFPANAIIYIKGLPGGAREGPVFSHPRQPQYALQLAYSDPTMQIVPIDEFPFVTQDLQRTFFLEDDAGQLEDRGDLIQALQDRRSCPTTSDRPLKWGFRKSAGGWEAWNEISGWKVNAGVLSFTNNGKDSFMGSPFLEIPVNRLGPIEIRIAAQSTQPTVRTELYWQMANMKAFSPDLHTGFSVRADGSWQVYSIQIPDSISGKSNNPTLIRLRLDEGVR